MRRWEALSAACICRRDSPRFLQPQEHVLDMHAHYAAHGPVDLRGVGIIRPPEFNFGDKDRLNAFKSDEIRAPASGDVSPHFSTGEKRLKSL